MAMTPSGRANAIYNAVQASNPNFASLSPSEKAAFMASILAIWGNGDLPYIQGNATVTASGADPQGGTVLSTGTVS